MKRVRTIHATGHTAGTAEKVEKMQAAEAAEADTRVVVDVS